MGVNIRVTVSKNVLIVFTIILLLLLISIIVAIYQYKSLNIKPKQDFIASETITDEQADKYLDGILLASYSDDIAKNEGFVNLVDTLNISILQDYAKKSKLTKDESKELIDTYYSSRGLIIKDIHKNMVKEQYYTSNNTDIEYKYLNSLNGFAESFSGFACSMTSYGFLARFPQFTRGNFMKYIAIKPTCIDILSNVINPTTKYLRDKAIIKDMRTITTILEKRVRSSVLKLATVEEELEFSTDVTDSRHSDPFGDLIILGDWEWDSNSRLDAEVKALIVAGFDLSSQSNFQMKVNHKNRILSIYLPNPRILYTNVDVTFNEPTKEWGAPKIDSSTYNEVSAKAEAKALSLVGTSDLFEQARLNAYTTIMNIFEPLMALPQFNYTVKVYFNKDIYNKKTL